MYGSSRHTTFTDGHEPPPSIGQTGRPCPVKCKYMDALIKRWAFKMRVTPAVSNCIGILWPEDIGSSRRYLKTFIDWNLWISFTRNGVSQKELWVKSGLQSHPNIFVVLCSCTMTSLLRLAVLLMVYDVLLTLRVWHKYTCMLPIVSLLSWSMHIKRQQIWNQSGAWLRVHIFV